MNSRVQTTLLMSLGRLAAVLLLLAGTALAADVSVDCDAGDSLQAAINSLDFVGPHTITVTGTCTENVVIGQRERLTILAPGGQTATIQAADSNVNVVFVSATRQVTLRRLLLRGGAIGLVFTRGSEGTLFESTIEENTFAGININQESHLILGGGAPVLAVTVRNNGGPGITTSGGGLQVNGNLTVENNAGTGINVNGGRFILNGVAGDNTIRNNGAGVNVIGASATLNGQNLIQNNGDLGVQVAGSAFASINAVELEDGTFRFNTIEGHSQIGLHVAASAGASLFGPNKIRNNGSAGLTGIRGGVNVGTTSRIQLDAGNEITNNIGRGVASVFNGAVALTDTLISNNTEEGVLLIHHSVGSFNGNAIAGNGNANVSCDSTSLVFGDLTGITNIKCMKIERELGPPRPGKVRTPTVF